MITLACPYERNEVWYDVTLTTGEVLHGFFSTPPVVAKCGFWTVCLDEHETGWVDLNPAHIVSVRVSETTT